MHSHGGVLVQMPILGVHVPGIRTKIARRFVSSLLEGTSNSSSDTEDSPDDSDKPTNKGSMTIYIDDLINIIKRELNYASRMGDKCTYTQWAERMLRKASVVAIKSSLRDMVDAWVESLSGDTGKEGMECLSTPVVVARTTTTTELPLGRVMFPRETPLNNVGHKQQQEPPLITPPVDLTTDEEEDERDVVLSEIKEEAILQSLLHKRIMILNQRVLTLEHKNGRKFRVVVPPESQSPKSFVEEAKRSRWINDMLHTDVLRRGMLQHLAVTQPKAYLRVAHQKKIRVSTHALNTPQTLALGRLTGINGTQMSKLRSFLKHVGNAELKLSKKDIERIDHDVGIHKCTPAPVFNSFTLEWSSVTGKNNEKKPPETCCCWNCDLLQEIADEIDLQLHSMFLEKPGAPDNNHGTRIPSLDYSAPGFDNSPGVVVLFGGDHGAGACPCHLKLNFASPEVRKLRGELNCRCPTTQIASIDCTKDTFELLSNTVMPRLKSQLIELRNSCALVVCSYKSPEKYRKAFLLPKNSSWNNIVFHDNQLTFQVGANVRTIVLGGYFDFEADDLDISDLRVTSVISNLNDLYVGDLAFLAMSIGMNNSAGAHCIQCQKKAADFNCDQMHPNEVRTKASLTTCLNEHNTRKLTSKSVRNHKGVNSIGLLDIDPQRIVVPMLHCPMGLVDKVLEVFKAWTTYEVENLPPDCHQIRESYKIAQRDYAEATVAEENAQEHYQATGLTPALMALCREAKVTLAEAKAEQSKAKVVFDEMVKRHNSRLFSLSQTYDTIFRNNKIQKEHYHGGKYNGVNCIKIMEKADLLFEAFRVSLKEKKVHAVSDETIDLKCDLFARMFGLLDAIWSNVRGIDAGLLPTAQQIQHLRSATVEAKTVWLQMDIGHAQPK